jgi:hypothetical protein
MEKERRHFSIFWPILLITVGIVLFLNNIGTISGDTWEVIWKLWPLLFIVGGIDGLVNRSGFAGPMVGIGLGTIFLLGNFGYLPVPALDVLIKFWPVLLIAWGIDLIIDHRGSRLPSRPKLNRSRWKEMAQPLPKARYPCRWGSLFWGTAQPISTCWKGLQLPAEM